MGRLRAIAAHADGFAPVIATALRRRLEEQRA
jgi:hypothetical protein